MIDGKSPDDDRMKIESLDEHPEEVGQQQIVEHGHHQLTQTLNTHTPKL